MSRCPICETVHEAFYCPECGYRDSSSSQPVSKQEHRYQKKDLIQFYHDAVSYYSVKSRTITIEEFAQRWAKDKIGQDALMYASYKGGKR